MLGKMLLDTVEPCCLRLPVVADQAIAFPQRGFVTRRMACVKRIERKDHPVEEAAARARAVGEEPVHRRGQPADGKPFAQSNSAALAAVDPDQPPAGPCRVDVATQPYSFGLTFGLTFGKQRGTDCHTAGSAAPDHVSQRSAAKSSARREQGQGL